MKHYHISNNNKNIMEMSWRKLKQIFTFDMIWILYDISWHDNYKIPILSVTSLRRHMVVTTKKVPKENPCKITAGENDLGKHKSAVTPKKVLWMRRFSRDAHGISTTMEHRLSCWD